MLQKKENSSFKALKCPHESLRKLQFSFKRVSWKKAEKPHEFFNFVIDVLIIGDNSSLITCHP